MAERRHILRARGLRRLILVFAGSVLLPAVALAILAYRQVDTERRALRAEREGAIRRVETRIRADLLAAFETLRRDEEERPWFHYNPLYYDPAQVGRGMNYMPSPIKGDPPNALVAAYFEVQPTGEIRSPNDPIPGQTGDPSGRAGAPQQLVAQEEAREQVQKKIIPNLDQNRANLPAAEKGKFENGDGNAKNVWVDRRDFLANAGVREQIDRIVNGMGPPRIESDPGPGEPVEVVISSLSFEADGEGGVLAWRYVDVPAMGGGGLVTYDRYVQGFRVDMEHVREALFPDLVKRYRDVPGVRVALERAGPGTAANDVLPPLPGWLLGVADVDPGIVGRRVADLSKLLLTAAALALLAITGGLLFTLRAVREELSLARRRSDFVAAVTHELRTPLTAVKMYADMLREGWVTDDSTRDEYVGFMAAETDRLSRLVNRVLDFARAERTAPELATVDLEGPVRAVARDFGPSLAAEGFELEVAARPAPPALANEDAVKQILLNLLDNARKYAAEATDRRVLVTVGEEDGQPVLAVADHGPGIPRAERERIFEDFYRPGEELTRETQGAGIGLALVRRLAAAMGARIDVRETAGGGATFRIAFRRK